MEPTNLWASTKQLCDSCSNLPVYCGKTLCGPGFFENAAGPFSDRQAVNTSRLGNSQQEFPWTKAKNADPGKHWHTLTLYESLPQNTTEPTQRGETKRNVPKTSSASSVTLLQVIEQADTATGAFLRSHVSFTPLQLLDCFEPVVGGQLKKVVVIRGISRIQRFEFVEADEGIHRKQQRHLFTPPHQLHAKIMEPWIVWQHCQFDDITVILIIGTVAVST